MVGSISAGNLYDALRCHGLPAHSLLGIRVVAVSAAQGAALQKENRSGARAVHQAHGFDGVYKALHSMPPYLDSLVERPVDYVQLMLPPQLVEPHGIAGNPNGEVGVLLWMIHGIDEQGLLQDIDVKMESAGLK